jgi:hypothetical protein
MKNHDYPCYRNTLAMLAPGYGRASLSGEVCDAKRFRVNCAIQLRIRTAKFIIPFKSMN